MRRLLVLGGIGGLLTSSVVLGVGERAVAVRVPKTLAQSAPVGVAPVAPGFPIDFVGVLWDGGAANGAVRFRRYGAWGPWQPLHEDGVEVAGAFASALVAGDDADAYQVRLPPGLARPRAVAINTTDGPLVDVGSTAGDAAGAALNVVSRAQWGADESLRFDASGTEIWPPAYYPAQKLTVHHTATRNDDPNPAATVRAIYRYHAVDQGFGDIGYQYLIDEQGRVYEGRWSGVDGDPGHDATGAAVTAAHVGGYNSGNIATALLGTLTDRRPSAAAQHELEVLLADLAQRHQLDPAGSGVYTNPVNGVTWSGPNISGHRDWAATECPGGALYALLPTIRADVAALVTGSTTTSTTTTTTSTTTTTTVPADTAPPVISGVRTSNVTATGARVRWTTNEAATSSVDAWIDGQPRVTATAPGLVTVHDVAVTGLKSRTTYRYQVRSTDAAGNQAIGAVLSFTTKR